MMAQDLELKKLASQMRLKGDLFKYEVDSISGKLKVKKKREDRYQVVTDKEDLFRMASQ